MSDVDEVRRAYEASLSWRLTRPVRAAGRLARRARPVAAERAPDPRGPAWDTWLRAAAGEVLDELEPRCAELVAAGRTAEAPPLFRGLDVDVWALLLTGEHSEWPSVRAALPAMPDPHLQEWWNGASGLRLADQSTRFAARVLAAVDRYGDRPLADCRALDHGCGWGRLLRVLCREVAPGALHGVDPSAAALAHAREDRVPAALHRIDPWATRLPVEDVDVAWSFSVFTHLSEPAADRALDALHAAISPGGLLVATVRPPAWLRDPSMAAAGRSGAAAVRAAAREAHHVFVPHAASATHPLATGADGRALDYGDAVVTVPWVRERWAPRFALLEVGTPLGDLQQLVLVLRRTP